MARRDVDPSNTPPRSRGPRHASGIAAARVLLESKLGWLDGFPAAGGEAGAWIRLSRPDPAVAGRRFGAARRLHESMVIRRADLAASTRAIRRLRDDFPRAMPKLVGDPDVWFASVASRLEGLKPVVHRGHVPPPRPPVEPRVDAAMGRAASRWPGLSPVLDALAWIREPTEDRLARHIGWIDRHGDRLERLLRGLAAAPPKAADGTEDVAAPITALVRVVRLGAGLSGRESGDLLALLTADMGAPSLGDLHPHDRPVFAPLLEDGDLATRKPWSRRLQGPAWIYATIVRLSESEPAAVRWFARIAGVAPIASTIAAAATRRGWERAIARETMPARRRRIVDRTAERVAARTAPIDPENVAHSIVDGVRDLSPRALGELRRSVGLLESPADAAAAVIHWGGMLRESGSKATPIIRGMRRYFDATAAIPKRHDALDALTDVLRTGWTGWSLDHAILAGRPPEVVTRFFDAMIIRVRDQGIVDPNDLVTAASLADVLPSGAMISEAAAGLEAAGRDRAAPLRYGNTHAAVQLVDPRDPRFVAVVREIERHSEDDDNEHIVAIWAWLAEAAGDREALIDAMLGRAARRIRRLISRVRTIISADTETNRSWMFMPAARAVIAAPSKSRRPRAWVARHPPRLRPLLARLDRLVDDAEARSAAVLAGSARAAASLERELAAIEARVADAEGDRRSRLEARRESLRSRIRTATGGRSSEPSRSSAGRPAERRLEEVVTTALIDRLERRIDEATGDLVSRAIGRGDVERLVGPSADHGQVLEVLAAVARLRAPYRALAKRVLARRLATPPEDLSADPANRRFVQRMRRLGLEMGPWLEGIPEQSAVLEGRPVRLSVTTDSMEILRMGAPWGTCLSPGRMNFWSTPVIAGDINKQVVVARDGGGRMVARCLLVLTAAGGLAQGHVYAHAPLSESEPVFERFTLAMAKAIGAPQDQTPEIPTLLAPDWYDDGAEGAPAVHAFLEEESELRSLLPDVPFSEASAAITAAMAPHGPDPGIIGPILRLPEVGERPELGRIVLGLVPNRDMLPDDAVRQGVRLAAACDPPQAPDPMTLARAVSLVVDDLRNWQADHASAFLLARSAPTLMRRRLDATRLRERRRWNDECEEAVLRTYQVLFSAVGRGKRPREAARLADAAARTRRKSDRAFSRKLLETAERFLPPS